MKKLFSALLLTYAVALISCKEDVKSDIDAMTEISSDSIVIEVNKEVIQQSNDEKVRQSVMTKIMMTPELSNFSSHLVSANLTNMLATEEGPFAIFAPTNEAFSKLLENKKKLLANPKNRGVLMNTLGQHIVFMPLSSDYIVQALRSKDTLKYNTMSGAMMQIVRKENVLYVIDQNGSAATIGKSDIIGNNGTIHLIDKVLGMD